MVKLYSIGGYGEIGKNMTVLDLGNDAIILDCGLFLPAIVELEERENVMNEGTLRKIGALPDDKIVERLGLRNKVRAILASHAHLDHIGAIPYLGYRYNANVISTPFAIEVLKTLYKDENARIMNNLISTQPNSFYTIKGKNGKSYKAEFLNITHSTLQTALIAIHTDSGVILYANDFKFDNSPILGRRPNYEKLKELARKGKGVLALVVDSLYADTDRKTPSEKIARGLLEDVMLTTTNENAGLIITTFASHQARLKSIVDFGKQLGRKIFFIGRSLRKYTIAATKTKLIPFSKDITLCSYKNEVLAALKKVNKNKNKYLLAVTGHQGEPGSVLDRLSRNLLPFNFSRQDHVIFSSKTIPTSINIANKSHLEKRLKQKGLRIFDEVHVSGHAGREDLRDLINMTQPKHLIPAHGDLRKMTALAELASELGYRLGKDCHIMQDNGKLVLS